MYVPFIIENLVDFTETKNNLCNIWFHNYVWPSSFIFHLVILRIGGLLFQQFILFYLCSRNTSDLKFDSVDSNNDCGYVSLTFPNKL